MIKQKTTKICKNCGKEFKIYNTIQKFCSEKCKRILEGEKELKPINWDSLNKPRKPINKVSKKKAILDLKYLVLRKEFLGKKENQICPITKQQAIEIHHTYCGKDRQKYYLEVETWIAVSRDGHNWIHDYPKEARELGYLK